MIWVMHLHVTRTFRFHFIEGCEFNDTSDAMLIFTGICSGAQAENFSLKNCAVLNNVFNFDSNAVSLVAADHFGTGDAGGFSQNMAIQNVKISGNTMIKRGDFFDTNCAGVILFTILHESGICRSFHDSIRHIEITGNNHSAVLCRITAGVKIG